MQAGGQRTELRDAGKATAAAARLQASVHLLPPDPIDGALYAYVSMRLQRDLHAHRVRPECCPTYETVAQAASTKEVCT